MTASLRIVGDPLAQLAADLRALDPRVEVEIIEPWRPLGCQLCQMLDCDDDAVVMWWHGEAYREVRVNAEHLAGWLSGFVIPDAADEQIRVEIGRAA
jgi:hypothetical protein